MANTIITATGSYLPTVTINNQHFLNYKFYDANGNPIERPNPAIIQKLYEITGIRERRYVPDHLTTADIAYLAAKETLQGIDPESLDYIIVAQNFGAVSVDTKQFDMVPTVAARVKQKLMIKNPYTVALDLPFGCPGWLQGVIMANSYIKSGDARRILVIGAETLSRVSDPHDVDCMIYADGAGAALVEATDQAEVGVLSHVSRSDTHEHAYLLQLGESYNPDLDEKRLYLKMQGHDIYKYALKTVPEVVKKSLERAGVKLGDIKKVLIHQANEKMDQAILKRIFGLYEVDQIPDDIMPMTISWLGNSSVATLPTLLDLLLKDKLDGHRLHSGDVAVFASVGAGMNINAMVYQMP